MVNDKYGWYNLQCRELGYRGRGWSGPRTWCVLQRQWVPVLSHGAFSLQDKQNLVYKVNKNGLKWEGFESFCDFTEIHDFTTAFLKQRSKQRNTMMAMISLQLFLQLKWQFCYYRETLLNLMPYICILTFHAWCNVHVPPTLWRETFFFPYWLT